MVAFNPGLTSAIEQLAGGDANLKNSFLAGLGISGLGSPTVDASQGFFPFGSLGRVTDTLQPDQAELLNRFKGESFIGGQRSGETQAGLDFLFNLRDTAGQTDPVLQEILDLRRGGLEGLTGQELQGFREQGAEEINRQLQTGLRGLSIGAAGRGVRGGAAGIGSRDLVRQSVDARGDLERDLFLANVAERNRRLNEFQGLASQIDNNRFGRQFEAGTAAQQALFGTEQAETSDRLNRLNQFANLQEGIRNSLLQRQIFNINQLGREKAGQLGVLFGAGGFGAQQGAQQQAFDLAGEQLDILKSQPAPVTNITFPNLGGGDQGLSPGGSETSKFLF